MKRNIILEGFWNSGKSAVAANLAAAFGYEIVKEPDHLREGIVSGIDDWYLLRHRERQELFRRKKEKTVMERSMLSSAAYRYAAGEDVFSLRPEMEDFAGMYAEKAPLVVMLYAAAEHYEDMATGIGDERVRRMFTSDFARRYEHFYRVVLPFAYGVTPLMISVFREDGRRKNVEDIIRNMEDAVSENRIAQINVVCYVSGNPPLILALKRNGKKGGFWQNITGGVRVGELLRDSVLREIGEEVGVKAAAEKLLSTEYSFHYVGGEGYELNEYVFGYELGGEDAIVLSEEHTEYRFLPESDAIELAKYDGPKQAIREVCRKIFS